MSQNTGKKDEEKRKALDAENESRNQQLGLRQRWLDLLNGILNVEEDFYQVAICELATGKIWAEMGGFRVYDSSTRFRRDCYSNVCEQCENQSGVSYFKELKDQRGYEKPPRIYGCQCQAQIECVDEGLLLTSSNIKSIQQLEDPAFVGEVMQLP